ncbi:MAG: HNH endonuclease signature motif containing protein [Leclercia adecarboxylata]|nr:HNH endonuclease signature motif containing protein [Leclercia adecarboxylata]MDU1082782.1 HNH endonuclease signature motif containing protein [Leclercia adecarboxylata]
MPPRTPTPCRVRGCRALVPDRSGYCENHKSESWARHRSAKKNVKNPYGSKWRKQRDAAFKRDRGLCQPCLKEGVATPATEVDHIIPLAHGGAETMDNLQCICTPHHRHKTAREHARAGK